MQIGSVNFSWDKPVIMGVINVTPDSFSDGGSFFDLQSAVKHSKKLILENADILDIGGESTRPGAKPVTAEQEIQRVVPVIKAVREFSNIPISIDTQKAEVAREAINAGADMINDVSAGMTDAKMFNLAANKNVPICLMHMRGTPETMQGNTYYDDLFAEIIEYFEDRIQAATNAGISADNIILDPGIGFGKTADDNINLIKHLNRFKKLGKPLLIGTSRKSFIGKSLNLEVNERLEATLATLSKSFDNGASIFRVHDVVETYRYLSMYNLLQTSK
jgi:dihydropteroate synthase